jgi:hypothetical protein
MMGYEDNWPRRHYIDQCGHRVLAGLTAEETFE